MKKETKDTAAAAGKTFCVLRVQGRNILFFFLLQRSRPRLFCLHRPSPPFFFFSRGKETGKSPHIPGTRRGDGV